MWRAKIRTDLRGGLARLAIALALILAAAPAAEGHAALEADLAPVPPAVFLIEKITVEGTRHASPDLIVAESLLSAGQRYTETALRQGVYRVRRLPFVRAARFSLRKGSERGSYELVITVEETHRVFFGAETFLSKGDDWTMNSVGAVGARAFVGAHGVAFAALRGGEVRAGYTHYNLLDRRAFASLEVSHTDDCCDGLVDRRRLGGSDVDGFTLDSNSAELTLGFPVARNQTVQLSVLVAEVENFGLAITLTPEGERFEERFPADEQRRQVALRWVYDTSDDPVVPSRGMVATVAIFADESESDTRFSFPGIEPGEEHATRVENGAVSGSVEVRRFWPLSVRQSVSLAGSLSASRFRHESELCCVPGPERFTSDGSSEGTGLDLGYSASLWSDERTRRFGDFRFEANVSSAALFDEGFDDSILFTDLEAGLVFRNAWGIFRFRIFYHFIEG